MAASPSSIREAVRLRERREVPAELEALAELLLSPPSWLKGLAAPVGAGAGVILIVVLGLGASDSVGCGLGVVDADGGFAADVDDGTASEGLFSS